MHAKCCSCCLGWESISRLNVSDKLCGDMLSPFFPWRFRSAALCRVSKKSDLFWLSGSSLYPPSSILLEMQTHEHICTLGQERLVHPHVWDQENKKFSSLFFCWETGPLCPHSSSFRAHSLLTLPSHKSSFPIYNPLHCSAPPHLNSLNLT